MIGNKNRDFYSLDFEREFIEILNTAAYGILSPPEGGSRVAKTTDMLSYSSNDDFWSDIIKSGQTKAGTYINLKEFHLTEWIPRSPGTYFLPESIMRREKAMKEFYDHTREEYLPVGMSEMVFAGLGSLRLDYELIANDQYAFLGATSDGITHEGIPVAVRKNEYEELIDKIRKFGGFICNISGNLGILPSLVRQNVNYNRGIPKFYLKADNIDSRNLSGKNDLRTSIAIAFSADILKSHQELWSFSYFDPSKEGDLKRAADWLWSYAQRYSGVDNPQILSDFDARYEHFPTDRIEFPVRDLVGGNLNKAKIAAYEASGIQVIVEDRRILSFAAFKPSPLNQPRILKIATEKERVFNDHFRKLSEAYAKLEEEVSRALKDSKTSRIGDTSILKRLEVAVKSKYDISRIDSKEMLKFAILEFNARLDTVNEIKEILRTGQNSLLKDLDEQIEISRKAITEIDEQLKAVEDDSARRELVRRKDEQIDRQASLIITYSGSTNFNAANERKSKSRSQKAAAGRKGGKKGDLTSASKRRKSQIIYRESPNDGYKAWTPTPKARLKGGRAIASKRRKSPKIILRRPTNAKSGRKLWTPETLSTSSRASASTRRRRVNSRKREEKAYFEAFIRGRRPNTAVKAMIEDADSSKMITGLKIEKIGDSSGQGMTGESSAHLQENEQILERYADATFPKRIPLGESALLRVIVRGTTPNKIDQPQISQAFGIVQVATDGKQDFEDILVSIDPQSVAGKFEVKGRVHRVIHLPVTSKEDSKPVFFELVAKGVGNCNIILEFIQRSEFIGNVELETEIIRSDFIADNRSEQEQQQTRVVSGAWNIAVGMQDSFPYDDEFLGLIIRQSSSRYTYDVLIQRGTHIEELDSDNPTIITLQNDPAAIFRKYFEIIENNNTIPLIHDDKLRSIGKSLYKEIFPKILKDFIWEHRDEIKRIHVLSKEEWIPWEITVPFEGSEEDEFLCQRYNFSRFLLKQPISTVLIEKAKIIGLPNSFALKDELNWLTNTFSQANLFDKRPASSRFEVIEGLFKKGGYELLHLSSHGQHDDKAPMLSTISLEDDDKISPNDLLGSNSKFGEDHPLVILNSCQSARQAYSITGIQSWVRNFIDAGAAAVIGTAWSVDEESAVGFSKALYTNLSNGDMTVAEAVHKTRLDCKKTGNATWLAYVYYGSPALKIRFGT